MSEPEVIEEFFGGPGEGDRLNAAAALGQALRGFAATEAAAAAHLRACLPSATDAGVVQDVRRAKAVSHAAGEAAARAVLLLEAASVIEAMGEAEALSAAARRLGLPPATLAAPIRAAALSLPTDDASARIAAAIRAADLVAALS